MLRWGTTVLVVVAVVCGMAAEYPEVRLPTPSTPYKILVPIPALGNSHFMMMKPLLSALLHRGHQIVTLQRTPKKFDHPNMTEIVLQLPIVSPTEGHFINGKGILGGFSMTEKPRKIISAKFYTFPEVMDLFKRRREFDLVISAQLFNEMALPFCSGVPCITLAVAGPDPRNSAIMGNLLSPAYSFTIQNGYPRPISFVDRIRNLAVHICMACYWDLWEVNPTIEKLITPYLPDIPPLAELEKNVSLVLINSHFTLTHAVPLLPSQVEVAGIHCHAGQPLSQDLREWVDGSGAAGVVYFSLGSVVRGNAMPAHYRRLFLDAFATLKYRVIWKFESQLEDIPSNVLVRDWLPQQDLLSDPRVKVFITHGGMFSAWEAVCHTTPVLALPVFADQPRNAFTLADHGLGLVLQWEKLTVELIADSIIQLAENPKYLRKMSQANQQLRDQLESPLERAVYWTEYVARHRGATQLKSPAADLTWIQFLMLDVMAVIVLFLLALVAILNSLLRCLIVKVTHKYKGTR